MTIEPVNALVNQFNIVLRRLQLDELQKFDQELLQSVDFENDNLTTGIGFRDPRGRNPYTIMNNYYYLLSQFEGNNDLLKASFDFYRVSSGFGPVHAAFNKYGLSIHDRLTQAEIHPDVSYGISLDGYLPLKKKSLSLLTDALKEQILTEVPKDTLGNDPVLLLPKSLIPKRSNYELYFAILAPIAYALPLASSKVEKNRDA